MSSLIFRDLAAIRERQEREDRLIDEMLEREQERIERERPWSPAEIIWESEWHQGFGEEAREFIGRDEGKYYCAFTPRTRSSFGGMVLMIAERQRKNP